MAGSLGTNFQEDTDQEETVPFPQVLESFAEAQKIGLLEVKQIACGENFTMCITYMPEQNEKTVFVWGSNDRK